MDAALQLQADAERILNTTLPQAKSPLVEKSQSRRTRFTMKWSAPSEAATGDFSISLGQGTGPLLGWLYSLKDLDPTAQDNLILYEGDKQMRVALSPHTGFIERASFKRPNKEPLELTLTGLDLTPHLTEADFKTEAPYPEATDTTAAWSSQLVRASFLQARLGVYYGLQERFEDGLTWDANTEQRIQDLWYKIHSLGTARMNSDWIESTQEDIAQLGAWFGGLDENPDADIEGILNEREEGLAKNLDKAAEYYLKRITRVSVSGMDPDVGTRILKIELDAAADAFEAAVARPLMDDMDWVAGHG
jgi:hypothetical protein